MNLDAKFTCRHSCINSQMHSLSYFQEKRVKYIIILCLEDIQHIFKPAMYGQCFINPSCMYVYIYIYIYTLFVLDVDMFSENAFKYYEWI